MSLFEELKRRNVVRVALAYAVAAWLLLQVIDVLLPILEMPNWVAQLILILMMVGFFVAVIFAWAYELTPKGLKRDSEVRREDSIAHHTARKLDWITIALLIVVGAIVLLDRFVLESAVPRPGTSPEVAAEPHADIRPETSGSVPPLPQSADKRQSVAVLPFVNMSPDPDQEYFSDGMTEEIINAVVKIPGLSVPARTSVFGFKGEQGDVRAIGLELGVAHILEGSVRSQGDHVRITAQLIKVDDGFHLWSETFDRELINVFAVQEEIANAIAGVLVGELGVQSVPNRTLNMNAYDLYLQGRALLRLRDTKGIEYLEAATRADPEYAPAWAALAIMYQFSSYWEGKKGLEEQLKAEKTARHALSLDPENVDAMNALASVLRDTWRWAEAEKMFQQALSLDPQSPELLEDWAEFLISVGRLDEMLEVAETAFQLDPNLGVLADVYIAALRAHGRYEEALAVVDGYSVIHPYFGPTWKFRTLVAMGDTDAAIALWEAQDQDEFPADVIAAHVSLLRNTDDREAPRVLKQHYSAANDSIYVNRILDAPQTLAFSGDAAYVVDTLIALYGKAGWGNAEEIFDASLVSIRSQPRFPELLELLNLPDYWDQSGWPEVCQRDEEEQIQCR